MAKFLIAVEGFGKEESDALTSFLQAKQCGFWHYIESVWLVSVSSSPAQSAQELFDEIAASLPWFDKATAVIVRVDEPMTFWGRANKAAWAWMRKYWGSAG